VLTFDLGMLTRALDIAMQSTYLKHRVGCLITDKRGRVISTGFNKRATHPLQKYYAGKAHTPERCYIHAEIMAIARAARSTSCPYAIFVARLTKGGRTGLARPCPICMLAICEMGIKEIHYTC